MIKQYEVLLLRTYISTREPSHRQIYIQIYFLLNFQYYKEIIKLSETVELESDWCKEDDYFIVYVMWLRKAFLYRSYLSLDQNELRP